MKYVPKYSIKEESCDSKKDEPIKKVNINPKAKPKDVPIKAIIDPK